MVNYSHKPGPPGQLLVRLDFFSSRNKKTNVQTNIHAHIQKDNEIRKCNIQNKETQPRSDPSEVLVERSVEHHVTTIFATVK